MATTTAISYQNQDQNPHLKEIQTPAEELNGANSLQQNRQGESSSFFKSLIESFLDFSFCCNTDTRSRAIRGQNEQFEIETSLNPRQSRNESRSTASIAVRHRSRSKNESAHAKAYISGQTNDKQKGTTIDYSSEQNSRRGFGMRPTSGHGIHDQKAYDSSTVDNYTEHNCTMNMTLDSKQQKSSCPNLYGQKRCSGAGQNPNNQQCKQHQHRRNGSNQVEFEVIHEQPGEALQRVSDKNQHDGECSSVSPMIEHDTDAI